MQSHLVHFDMDKALCGNPTLMAQIGSPDRGDTPLDTDHEKPQYGKHSSKWKPLLDFPQFGLH